MHLDRELIVGQVGTAAAGTGENSDSRGRATGQGQQIGGAHCERKRELKRRGIGDDGLSWRKEQQQDEHKKPRANYGARGLVLVQVRVGLLNAGTIGGGNETTPHSLWSWQGE